MAAPSISVVVISRNEGAYLARTIEALEATLPKNADIVVVDDGSEDGSAEFLTKRRGRRVRLLRGPFAGMSVGVAKARNFGARETRGEIVVFSDAHMDYREGWWQPLVRLLQQPGVGGASPLLWDIAGQRPRSLGAVYTGPDLEVRWLKPKGRQAREAAILPGACMAMRRDVFEAVGGWDEGMLQRGNVDNEACVRLWLAGYRLLVTSECEVGHLFRKRSPYFVGWPEYLHNRLRTAFVHFKPERVAKVVAALQSNEHLGEALLLVAESDAGERRKEWMTRRARSDDWFFERFELAW